MDKCPICGADRNIVGRVHRCVPKPVATKLPVPAVKARKAAVPEPVPPIDPPIKRGRPRIGEPPRPRPWEALGMSKRTWQRRRAEARRLTETEPTTDGDPT